MGVVNEIPNDFPLSIPNDLKEASFKLDALIQSFPRQGILSSDIPFISPYRLNECGWVADLWLEFMEILCSTNIVLCSCKALLCA